MTQTMRGKRQDRILESSITQMLGRGSCCLQLCFTRKSVLSRHGDYLFAMLCETPIEYLDVSPQVGIVLMVWFQVEGTESPTLLSQNGFSKLCVSPKVQLPRTSRRSNYSAFMAFSSKAVLDVLKLQLENASNMRIFIKESGISEWFEGLSCKVYNCCEECRTIPIQCIFHQESAPWKLCPSQLKVLQDPP